MTIGEQVAAVVFTPDGNLALTADNGNSGSSDGHVDTVSVIDLQANPPRVIANKNGKVAVLKIDGKKVTKVKEIEVGGLPEGVVFSPDGKYAYVGNYTTQDVSILKIDGAEVTDTGKRLALPGHPASRRGRAR